MATNKKKITTTMLPFFRQEPDGTTSCFQVEIGNKLAPDQRKKLRKALTPFFKYLPNHTVKSRPDFSLKHSAITGPRLTIETPFSSSSVEIFERGGIGNALRVEKFVLRDSPGDMEGLYDPVTECVYDKLPGTFQFEAEVEPVKVIPLLEQGLPVLTEFSKEQNLGFNEYQLKHIEKIFTQMEKNPTDVALYQLAQMWSDHCRHLLFNAKLTIDGKLLSHTLFDLLRAPYKAIKGGPTDNVLIGFFDNASAITGTTVGLLVPADPGMPCEYVLQEVTLHHILSGETHNYPSHVCPYWGTATEIGGEIRDQLGVGSGSDILYAGCGRVVGSIWFPDGYRIPGEILSDRLARYTYPDDKATPIKIVLDGLDGFHFYGNCFGKPVTYGFFYSGAVWRPVRAKSGEVVFERIESLKPVCFGVSGGTVRQEHLEKKIPTKGMAIVQIGGPAYPVGFCGGSGSSSISGSNVAKFDENAVQRGNPEMERRFYQVLLTCINMGIKNVIQAIHDQGAGGIANVLTELVEKSGGRLFIGSVNRGDPTMSDVKVWVCEYQERQGVVIDFEDLPLFLNICKRENCPVEVIGHATNDGRLVVYSESSQEEVDEKGAEPIIELDLAQVLEEMPPLELSDKTPEDIRLSLKLPDDLTFEKAVELVLRRSEVGSKEWAIRTVDGSIGGQVVENQRCGPFGIPVNDFSLVALSQNDVAAQAASLGLAPYVTALDPVAGGRMAIGEMITQLMGVAVDDFEHIQSICNWMWPANIKPPNGELARLVAAATGISDALKELVLAIIGGKDSSSLATKVKEVLVKSLETIVFSSVAHVPDYRLHITPEIKHPGTSQLLRIDIANGKRRLGGSSFAQCFGQLGDETPDLDNPVLLIAAFEAVQILLKEDYVTAGHDISDGGLFTTVAEMCIAANCGVNLNMCSDYTVFEELFAQELGYVVEVPDKFMSQAKDVLTLHEVPFEVLGNTQKGLGGNEAAESYIGLEFNGGEVKFKAKTNKVRRMWERTGHEFRKLRMNCRTAKREWDNTKVAREPIYRCSFSPYVTPPDSLLRKTKPKMAVIREQGSNGYPEMLESWHRAGFEVWDVHMNDIGSDKPVKDLRQFKAIALPGGFSYGDVLGASVGWVMRIKNDPYLNEIFDDFYQREDSLSLGICNGAQWGLRIGWAFPNLSEYLQPRFTTNQSDSFQHQWIRLKINKSPSIMLAGMEGSILGAYVANTEGYFNCDHAPEVLDRILEEKLAPLVYVDPLGRRTTAPPWSPSGSFVAGVCDSSGRHLYMMPHAFDRASLPFQWQYWPREFECFEASPWAKIGQNAFHWCENS